MIGTEQSQRERQRALLASQFVAFCVYTYYTEASCAPQTLGVIDWQQGQIDSLLLLMFLLIDWVDMEKLAISEGKDPGECASLVSSPVKQLSNGQHGTKNLNQRQCHCVCNFQQESRRDGGQKEERYNLWIMMVIVIKLFKLGKEYHTGKLSTIRGKSPPIKCKLLTNRLFLLAPKACFAFGLDCLLFRSSILDDFES